ncbi:MAG: sugar phosphate nucleotidyltransferase [Eubacteriales bacterium]
MKKPVLVIMAAGMGSRYGGLKQIDPIDKEGHIIMDFSIYDAKLAGFEKVVFIIKEENRESFQEVIGDRLSEQMEVEYVYQDVNAIPTPFVVPEGRVKPWGTGHAILSCIEKVDGPFAVINADDYYGREAFQLIYDFLATHEDDDRYRYTMVGYQLGNTVTENGHVARGVCSIDEAGHLTAIHERTRIEKHDVKIEYTEDDGESWVALDSDTVVSMNMWGFSASMLRELEKGFVPFLEVSLEKNPMKCEYFLPTVASDLVADGKATVEILTSKDKWYGVTYKEDKPVVEAAIEAFKQQGKYPNKLWEKSM